MSSPRPSSPSYTRAQLSSCFDARTLAEASALVSSVTGLVRGPDTLSATVRGTGGQSFETDVYFRRVRGETVLETECSCPLGYNCKHGVAVLLAGLDRPRIEAPHVRDELVQWLEHFREQFSRAGRASGSAGPRKTKNPTQTLAFVVRYSSYDRRHEVEFFKAGLDREGRIRSIGESWSNVENAIVKPPLFVSDETLAILRLLWVARSRERHSISFGLQGSNGAEILRRMLASGRLFGSDQTLQAAPVALTEGATRTGRMHWQPQSDDRLRPLLQSDPPASMVILTEPPWYIDEPRGEAGPLDVPWDTKLLTDYLSMPAVSSAEAPVVSAVLRSIAPELPTPPAHDEAGLRVIDLEPTPLLHLASVQVYGWAFVSGSRYGSSEQGGYRSAGGTSLLEHATVSFDYDRIVLPASSTTTLAEGDDGTLVQVKRHLESERRHLAALRAAGLAPIQTGQLYSRNPLPTGMLGLGSERDWPDFVAKTLPELRRVGWRVSMAAEFRFNVVQVDGIDGRIERAADGWFDLEMGIDVAGRQVRLEPLLAELFARDRRWLGGDLESVADAEAVELKSETGERLQLRADRLKPLVRLLVDLFDKLGSKDATLRLSKFDAARLEALSDTGRWQFHGDASLRQLAQRLRQTRDKAGGSNSAGGIPETPVPKGLVGVLRSYQREGLSWMQFLREHELSGVLADDMGLGKTIQALAHLLAEKEAGRLDRPALVVVPTSLVHNWCEEARQFAPGLKVLSLHGSQRKLRFEQIAEHDLVLTTYALLWRDLEALAKEAYHVLILDEAQSVKNASTKAAAAIRDLAARQRLCLTGTPIENHLGELWALFDFLLPGFLGTQQDFGKRWRTPIEKGGDSVRRELLARRIHPFMLRRRKDDVAKELPAKTTIVHSVELEGAQRDLYETVRVAMQDKVRAAIAEQGLQRSQIVVLDALLKLRQVCCDPRLVKLAQASRVKESAKLELLLTLLPSLIEDGRRVLLFSQFTGMLALIAEAATEAGIAFVTLTGQTIDRVAPVRRFQSGEVPLFLISLKAGGLGLNLTAADAVIHYDPWWNPAAENQATDRAHRLGQDKPVFVYKLIVAGSIEEKIIELQQKKAALVDGILANDGATAVKFSDADLDALFAPIE